MAYYTSAGTVLSVSSAVPATFDEAGFTALDFTVVGEVTSVPSHGADITLVTHNPLATRITGKRKGSISYGSITIPMALDSEDLGQDILREHVDGPSIDDPVAVEIQYPDGTTEYFSALVMSFMTNADGVDSILGAEATLEIDSPVVTVDQAEAPPVGGGD